MDMRKFALSYDIMNFLIMKELIENLQGACKTIIGKPFSGNIDVLQRSLPVNPARSLVRFEQSKVTSPHRLLYIQ